MLGRVGRRRFIPPSTKVAILEEIDRGRSRKMICDQFGLKNHSNINRILAQRQNLLGLKTLTEIHDLSEDNDDETEDIVDERENDSNVDIEDKDMDDDMGKLEDDNECIHGSILAIREQLENVKLGMHSLKDLGETIKKRLAETMKAFGKIENEIEEFSDKYIATYEEDDNDDSGDNEKEDDVDNDDEDDVNSTLDIKVEKMYAEFLLQLKILSNTVELLTKSLLEVAYEAGSLGGVFNGKLERTFPTNEDEMVDESEFQ